ncbi:putative dihydroorotase [Colletotrichum scovillei]|uniref:Dihydroorotase n=1 Tax=Colletotrichum scovillei TaxID=1209932 RepID=A0A9P7RFI7_9PEZI|nr:putative dihydroorotase [Colletotrichum scovillei]KAG7082479.1 putative dihydroorotase [Colletotrichum scovillei]
MLEMTALTAGSTEPISQTTWLRTLQTGYGKPDSQLDSYILALERKLEVFSENQHIIRTFRQLLELVEVVKQNGTEPRAEIGRLAVNLCTSRQWLPRSDINRLPTTLIDIVYNSIDFAIEILLLHRFNTTGESRPPGEHDFKWEKEDNIIVARRAILPQQDDSLDSKIFDHTFTLRDFQEFGDFVIQPTDNILEHLLMQKHKKRPNRITLLVFFHVSAMERIHDWNETLRPSQPGGRRSFIDSDFIEETLQTVSLILPYNDLESIEWFKRYYQKFQRTLPRRFRSLSGIDPRAGQLPVASRQAVDYNYWLPRLLELEKEFLNYSPRTLRQFLRDRRRYRDWTLYWVGLVALVLTLISSLTGVASAIVGGLALKDDKNDTNLVTAACCCRDEVALTNVVTTASIAPASVPVVTLEPAQAIDPTRTLVVTVRVTTTVTMTGA